MTDSDGEREKYWDGYADYKSVSKRISQTIEDAVSAYSYIDAAHSEQAPITREEARDARTPILNAAIMLHDEMQREAEHNDDYDDILARWNGQDGFVKRFDEISLREERPGWLYDFARDIRTAGWRLGYLQAGRTEREGPDDPIEEEAEEMFA